MEDYIRPYDTARFSKFVYGLITRGQNDVEVIIGKYEEPIYLLGKKVYHCNVLLKAGKKHISLLDFCDITDSDTQEEKAMREATDIIKRLKINGLKPTLQMKKLDYSWFFGQPKLD